MGNQTSCIDSGAMLNAYPDSMGGTLSDIVTWLQMPEMKDAFTSLYVLPSLFHSDLDRGFSVIDYGINEQMASREDLEALRAMGLSLKLDFVLNHASVLSPQFQDILKNGEQSVYRDFFIEWNKFWIGHGTMTSAGYIEPYPECIRNMFFRKPGLPILMVRMPNGKEVPYWNTFYQKVYYLPVNEQELLAAAPMPLSSAHVLAKRINEALDAGKKPEEIEWEDCRADIIEILEKHRRYLGQMDLNIQSPLVWEYYKHTLQTLAGYGARIVRLDAFAYAPKEPGARNFLNEPGTWELLEKLRALAEEVGVTLLPEIHASYAEGIYEKISNEGYMTYDFFLPGLILDALEYGRGDELCRWAAELQKKKIRTVNMLGCHDGIPLLDLKGFLPEEHIADLINVVVKRGGYVKNLHGQKKMYYQVNATYYSALGEDDHRFLLARALQLFMPGKPQVWYLDLFAGKNDYEAVARAGEGGHKEINRTNLTSCQVREGMQRPVVRGQLALLRFRNTFPAFGFNAKMHMAQPEPGKLEIEWYKDGCVAHLKADLKNAHFVVSGQRANGQEEFQMSDGEMLDL